MYCTLQDAKNEIKADKTVDDNKVLTYIRQVSNRIDSTMGSRRRPFFAPYTETRRRNISAYRIDSYNNTFYLGYHILSFSAVVRGGETITSNCELYAPDNLIATRLRITNQATTWYKDCSSTCDYPPTVVQVTGEWGWHEDYDNAFDSVDTVQDAGGINASVTSITVADADGVNLDNETPRFSAGNLIKIGSELMDVVATNTTTNVLTVRRARNGTTAAAHALNAAISVYSVDEVVNRVAARQAALLYARKGAFQVEAVDGVGVVSYPQDLLTELRAVLTEFQYG
jgi:hypothetical protein